MDILTIDELKQANYGRYLVVKQLGGASKGQALAWESFTRSLDAILFHVSEPGLRDIRYQWWVESYERAKQGHFSGHPFDGVLKRLTQLGLEKIDQEFHGLLASFNQISSYAAFQKISDWQSWLRDHFGHRLSLGCAVIGAPLSLPSKTLAAYSLLEGSATIMEHLPSYSASGFELLPRQLLDLHAIQSEQLLAGSKGDGDGWAKLMSSLYASCQEAELIVRDTPLNGDYLRANIAHAKRARSLLRRNGKDQAALINPMALGPLTTYVRLHWHLSRLRG